MLSLPAAILQKLPADDRRRLAMMLGDRTQMRRN